MALLEGGAPAHAQTPQPARTLTVFILAGHALGEAMKKLCAVRELPAPRPAPRLAA